MQITLLSTIPTNQRPALLTQLENIFFLSAHRQDFSPSEKIAFFERWTSYYLQGDHPILLALEGENLLGYLMGAFQSAAALPFYQDRLASYALFADLFPRFPAHLHINCHPDSRGKGVGGALIEAFCAEVKAQNLPGVHLVTSPTSRNTVFYRRHHFTQEEARPWRNQTLLFMGRLC